MEKRRLGKTDLQVARLGFGLSGIGSAELTDERAAELLNTALDGGVNFLDTAACYGDSEALIGRTVSGRRLPPGDQSGARDRRLRGRGVDGPDRS